MDKNSFPFKFHRIYFEPRLSSSRYHDLLRTLEINSFAFLLYLPEFQRLIKQLLFVRGHHPKSALEVQLFAP